MSGTPIYIQIGDSGRRFRIGEVTPDGPLSFAEFFREVADVASPPFRWFRDGANRHWRENPDGTLTMVYVYDDGSYNVSESWQGYDMEAVDELWGPLTEIEAPRAGDH